MNKFKVLLFIGIVSWLYACQPDLPPTPTTVAERPTFTMTPTTTPVDEGADPVPTVRPPNPPDIETALPLEPRPDPSPFPSRTPTPPPAISMPLPTSMIPPEPSPTALPSLPSGGFGVEVPNWTTIGTPLPSSGSLITSDNISQLVEVGRWGKGSVLEAAYSPDGTTLYALTSQGVYVYDSTTAVQQAFIPSSINPNHFAISPDGQRMALSNGERPYYHVEIWDIQSYTFQEAFFPFDENHRPVWGLKFDSSSQNLFVMGASIIVGGYNDPPIVAAWDISALTRLVVIEAYDFDYAPEVNLAAINGGDNLLYLLAWENQTFEEKRIFQIPEELNEGDLLAISPDGQFVALSGLGSRDSRIAVWQTDNDDPLYMLESSHHKQVGSLFEEKTIFARPTLRGGGGLDFPAQILFSPDSQQLAATASYYDVMIWQIGDGEKIQEWTEIGDHVLFHPNGSIISTWRDAISQWRVDDGAFVNVFNQHFGNISDIALIPNSNKIAIASYDGYIYLRQWQTGDLFTSLKGGISSETYFASSGVYDIDVTADGQTLVSASFYAYQAWNLNDYNMTILSPFHDYDVSAEQIVISNDGKYILGQEYDTEVNVWVNGETKASRGPLVSPWAIAFSPVSNVLAVTESLFKDRDVLWEVGTDNMMELPGVEQHGIETFSFSADGRYLAAGTPTDFVYLWSINGLESELIAQLSGGSLSTYGTAVAFSNDNQILAQSAREYVRFWDMNDWSLVYSLDTGMFVTAMTFSPEGDYLITGHGDGSVRFWAVP